MRVLVLIISVLMIYAILRGRSRYPRWMVIFTPIVILIQIFALYFILPRIGVYALPAAMNLAHVVFFLLSTWAATRIATN